MAALLLPLLLAASDQAASAYPAEAVLEAFGRVCRDVADYPATLRSARALGWKGVAASEEPHLQKLVSLGMGGEASEGRKQTASFRRAVEGRTLYLALSRYADAKGWGNGCRVYDFAARQPLPQPVVEKWMKRPADFRQAQEGVLVKLSWEPGWDGTSAVESAYVPPGSALTGRTGLAGNVLVAQAAGTP